MDVGTSTSSTQPKKKNNCDIISAATRDMDPGISKSLLQTCMNIKKPESCRRVAGTNKFLFL